MILELDDNFLILLVDIKLCLKEALICVSSIQGNKQKNLCQNIKFPVTNMFQITMKYV